MIGYVGMTGLAAGPHVHYEYRVNGVHKNPAKVTVPKADPIPASLMADFKAQTAPLLARLDPPAAPRRAGSEGRAAGHRQPRRPLRKRGRSPDFQGSLGHQGERPLCFLFRSRTTTRSRRSWWRSGCG